MGKIFEDINGKVIFMRYFHGSNKIRSYFEGWYFKHQNDEQTLAFIPGIRIDGSGKKGAFIQIITDKASYWASFPYDDFMIHGHRFCISIGGNVFSEKGVYADIQTDDVICKGSLSYGPFSVPSKDFMGPFKYVPFMECNHGVISTGHSVTGEMLFFDETKKRDEIIFNNNSSGYIETDWGSSFPESYIWTQCNRFPKEDVSVMVAAAVIPFLGTKFLGVTGTINCGGKEHRLATYKGAKVFSYDCDSLAIIQGKNRFEVSVFERNAQPLSAPVKGSMIRSIHESACCRARYRYWDAEKLILDAESGQASWEYVTL